MFNDASVISGSLLCPDDSDLHPHIHWGTYRLTRGYVYQ